MSSLEPREMAQLLRTPGVFPEDPDSILSIYTVARNCYLTTFPGDLTPS